MAQSVERTPRKGEVTSSILVASWVYNFITDNYKMASRTNKQGIAKKKAQLQKQASRTKWAKRFEYPKRRLDLNDWKERWAIWVMTNPKWNTYHWFLKWRKVCRETRLRTDPDGYRFIKTPSWGSEMVYVPASGWTRVRMRKMLTIKK